MNKIQVAVLAEGHQSPGGMMMFLARLTQRGHNIKSMDDLLAMYDKAVKTDPAVTSEEGIARREKLLRTVASLPHGTITRFAPITVAIVGASRRFLAQARTHQVGMTYVSASLQYSDYSDQADFVVPYEMLGSEPNELEARRVYLKSCTRDMNNYKYFIEECGMSNDTAGYAAPQGLRNILIMQGNNESWAHFIRMRSCRRNTTETRFVALKIWEELLKTTDGCSMFGKLGPDCVTGMCREGEFSCGRLMQGSPSKILIQDFPLLYEETFVDIPDYPGYKVSNLGRFFSTISNKYLKLSINSRGYAQLNLGAGKTVSAHVIVANAFIPNPMNKPCVNHKDHDKTNPCAYNLEWVTDSENVNYSKHLYDSPKKRKVDKFMLDGTFMETFDSVSEAGKSVGKPHANISACCIGTYQSAYGFIWKYHEEV